jgi:hypothetical protein
MDSMTTVLTVITGLCMLATLGVMLAGMLGMARSDTDATRSNVLMRWRVVLQGATLALFALLLLLTRH